MTNYTKSKFYESIKVCMCGHGIAHHKTKFGNCSCMLSNQYQRYKYDICSCQEFKLDWVIVNGHKMSAVEYEQLLSNSYAENQEH